jgi:hypothetical protein
MTITLVGPVTDRLGHAEYRSTRMEGACAVERRTFEAIPSCEYVDDQPSHIGVNVEHRGRERGEVVYLERDGRNSIWAVAVVSGCDSLLAPSATTMFFSPELRWRADARDVTITGLALVDDPATVGLSPVVVLAADVRDPGWSSRSHNKIPHVALLRRASAAHQRRRLGAPIVVADPHAATRTTQLAPGVWLDSRGERLPAEHRDGRYVVDDSGRPVGPVEHWPGGRILSVR